MSVLSTTQAHPDHFDATKFKPNGERIGPGSGRPRKLNPEQRAEIYLLQTEIRQRQRKIERMLEAAGVPKTGRSEQLLRIWREKGM